MGNDQNVVTIDGPSGSGKGTVAQLVATQLGWRYLDSGALYRVLGFLAMTHDTEVSDHAGLVALTKKMDLTFVDGQVLLAGEPVDSEIRSEEAGNRASKLAVIPQVRESLLNWQRNCAQPPGLVADGRDMGTVVFPDAKYKFF